MEREASEIDKAGPGRVTIWQTVGSVLAAFYGVQSSASRQRDFSSGDPLTFIVVGLVLTAMFVGVLLGIVKLVLHNVPG